MDRREPTASAKEGEVILRLIAWRYTLLSPREDLETMLSSLEPDESDAGRTPSDPEKLYEEERKLLDEREILPLVTLPDYVGLSPAVRDWLPSPWGEWNLDNVWLERGEKNLQVPAGTVPVESQDLGANR